jgi:hypothetical protein
MSYGAARSALPGATFVAQDAGISGSPGQKGVRRAHLSIWMSFPRCGMELRDIESHA